MSKTSPVEAYFADAGARWKPILVRLRALVQKTDARLEESLKWGAPSYGLGGIVVSFHGFKDYVAMWFPKGELLSDPKKILIKSPARHMRQVRFAKLADVDAKTLTAYIREAVALNDSGAKVKRAKVVFEMPPALKQGLTHNAKARATFAKLPPSGQRDYALYIGEAKRPETLERRLDKSLELLAAGKSLNEKYKK